MNEKSKNKLKKALEDPKYRVECDLDCDGCGIKKGKKEKKQ